MELGRKKRVWFVSVLSNYQWQQSFRKRRGYWLQLIIPSQGSGEAEKMRREVREDIPLCLRDKPEWVQFSGITCNDRRERAEKGAGDARSEPRGELVWRGSESGEALGRPGGAATRNGCLPRQRHLTNRIKEMRGNRRSREGGGKDANGLWLTEEDIY